MKKNTHCTKKKPNNFFLFVLLPYFVRLTTYPSMQSTDTASAPPSTTVIKGKAVEYYKLCKAIKTVATDQVSTNQKKRKRELSDELKEYMCHDGVDAIKVGTNNEAIVLVKSQRFGPITDDLILRAAVDAGVGPESGAKIVRAVKKLRPCATSAQIRLGKAPKNLVSIESSAKPAADDDDDEEGEDEESESEEEEEEDA